MWSNTREEVGIALPAAGPFSRTLLHPAKSIAMLKQTLDF